MTEIGDMTKRNSFIISMVFSSAVIGGLCLAPVAAAAPSCGGVDTAIIDCGGATGKDAIIDIIKTVIGFMTAGIGILAVGATIVGGILYASAGGNPENIKKATSIWTNTVIGLILFAFLVAITNFLIPGGVFS